MIAKISKGSSLYGALSYNQEKVDAGEGKILATNIINHPLDGYFHITDCMRDFENWMPSHYRTKNPVMHVSLNPHPDDKLTDQQLADIGEEYMQKMGYGSQPFIIYKHEDIDRHHIHVITLRVNSTGEKICDSFEHRRSKEVTEQIEQEYKLHPAEGAGKRQEEWQLTPVDYAKGDLKQQMSNVLKPLVKMYSFRTIGEYRALLSLYNITVEEIKGEVKGKPFNGLIYSALDTNGEKYGPPLKSSLFGKIPGYRHLQEQMKKNTSEPKSDKEKQALKYCRTTVSGAITSSRGEEEFRKKIKSADIDVILRRNDTGRIYGVTFIDHKNRYVLNGSRLGKDFSANMFNDWLNNNVRLPQFEYSNDPVDRNYTNPSIERHSQDEQDYLQHVPHDNNWSNSNDGDAISLFSFDPGPVSDEPIPRKKQKKKRRKPGQQL